MRTSLIETLLAKGKVLDFYPYTTIVSKVLEHSGRMYFEDDEDVEEQYEAFCDLVKTNGYQMDNKVALKIQLYDSIFYLGWKDNILSAGLDIWRP